MIAIKYIILVFLCLGGASVIAQEFELRNGDLIFQEACPEDNVNPIKQVTNSIDNYRFTHVGMVYIDARDSIYVLEATRPKVVLTPLEEYLYPAKAEGCYPVSVAGRLKTAYQPLIDKALEEGFNHIGKDYDHGFVLDNDEYYCSELIYEILKQANNGREVFPLNVMTFKAGDSSSIAPGWITYFEEHNKRIPEGELGINPGAMSRSDVIDIVYYWP